MVRQRKPQKDIDDAYREAVARYAQRSDITGIDIGYKYTNGQKTDTLAVRFHVKEKFPISALEAWEVFPEEIGGFPVDVIQARYVAGASPGADWTNRTGRFPRLQPGISIGHKNVTAGTLGLIVRDDRSGRPAILSNWHVLAGGGSASPGDPITQPGAYDGGRAPRDSVAALERMMLDEDGDAAIAVLTNARPYDLTICDLNTVVRHIDRPNIGDVVVKSGRTTQVTKGRVDGMGRYFIEYPVGRIGIDGFVIVPVVEGNPSDIEISKGGDSGSAWLKDGSSTMVGLHFAGETDPRPSQEHAVACFATKVFSRLSISLLSDIEKVSDTEEEGLVETLASQLGAAAASTVLNILDPEEIRRLSHRIQHSALRRGKTDEMIGDLVEYTSASETGPFGTVAIGFAAGAAARIIGEKLKDGEKVSAEAFPVAVAAFLAGAAAGARAVGRTP